jgi:hypothetical protein
VRRSVMALTSRKARERTFSLQANVIHNHSCHGVSAQPPLKTYR